MAKDYYRYNCVIGGTTRQIPMVEVAEGSGVTQAYPLIKGEQRRCANPGCITLLSESNPSKYCRRHQDLLDMLGAIRSRSMVKRRPQKKPKIVQDQA